MTSSAIPGQLTVTEAIAVYLTLLNKERSPREERAFSTAWGVILMEGERVAYFHGL